MLAPKELGSMLVGRGVERNFEVLVSGSEIGLVWFLVGSFLHMGLRDDDALICWLIIDGAILWTPLLTLLA